MTDTQLQPGDKPVKLVKIEFIQVESPVPGVVLEGADPDTLWLRANEYIHHCRQRVRSGYDKTDFVVTWEDGETYKGRFDMESLDKDGGDDTLRGHVFSCAAFQSGYGRPAHMTEADYQGVLTFGHSTPAERTMWLQFIFKYAIYPGIAHNASRATIDMLKAEGVTREHAVVRYLAYLSASRPTALTNPLTLGVALADMFALWDAALWGEVTAPPSDGSWEAVEL